MSMPIAVLIAATALSGQGHPGGGSKEASLFRGFQQALRRAERELRAGEPKEARRSVLEAKDYLSRVPSIPIIQTYGEEAAARCRDSLNRALDALEKARPSEALAAIMACRREARSVRRRWTEGSGV